MGLYYNLYRFYDLDIGKFILGDLILLRGGINLYVYVLNLISWIDFFGLRKLCLGFLSVDDVVRFVLSKYNLMFIFKNREYGGIIFRVKDGFYGYICGCLGIGRIVLIFKDLVGGLFKGLILVG